MSGKGAALAYSRAAQAHRHTQSCPVRRRLKRKLTDTYDFWWALFPPQVVMVGDQCQLPATVLSAEAQRRGLDVSLFERMLTLGMEVHMLGIQYRMHPLIAHFASWRFYRAELHSGIRVEDRLGPPGAAPELRHPVCFINVDGGDSAQVCPPSLTPTTWP